MILISGYHAEQINKYLLTELERGILQKKEKSPVTYRYDSTETLVFELKMRTRIVESAKALDASHASFTTFKNSRCNEKFWSRTENGGFQLKSGVLPSDAVSDIFHNGRLYGFECATAIVIVLYKAILDSIHKEPFNVFFKDLLLWDWNYDSDLRLISTDNKDEAYPGDVLYFKNPDYAPETPQWQGENAVMLADDLYYGHGIGIKSSEKMISSLNSKRKPGSTTSAYLFNQVVHPDFEYIRKLSAGRTPSERPIVAQIGRYTYM